MSFEVKYPVVSTKFITNPFMRRNGISWKEIDDDYKPLVKALYEKELSKIKNTAKRKELVEKYASELRKLNKNKSPMRANLTLFSYAMGVVGCAVSDNYCSAVIRYRINNAPAPNRNGTGPVLVTEQKKKPTKKKKPVVAQPKPETPKNGRVPQPKRPRIKRAKIKISPPATRVGTVGKLTIKLPEGDYEGSPKIIAPYNSGIIVSNSDIDVVNAFTFKVPANFENAKPGVYYLTVKVGNNVAGKVEFEVYPGVSE